MKHRWLQILGGGVAGASLFVQGCAEYDREPNFPAPYAAEAPTRSASAQAAQAPQGWAIPPAPSPSEDIQIGVDETTYADADPTALTEFRTTLDPHGAWVEDETYGTVWVPSAAEVGADFTPYVTAGRWTYDDAGAGEWIWVSDYDWGWAPFHYGRWVYIPGRGWAWIPGRAYRGAWVTWRLGYGSYAYIGWAPMAPVWYWHSGMAVGLYASPVPRYYYCPHGEVFAPGVGSRVVTGPAAVPIEANSRPYVLADPTVSRIPANPTVNGDRMIAHPGVMNGPPPSAFGVPGGTAPRPRADDSGLGRARTLATPSAAVAAGAAPPRMMATPRLSSPAPSEALVSRAPPAFAPRASIFDEMPASSPPHASAPSVFERSTPSISAPSQSRSIASPHVSSSVFDRAPPLPREPSFSHSAPTMSHSMPSPRISSVPHISASPSIRSSAPPMMRSAPSVSSPMRSPGGSVRASPSIRSRSK